MSCNVAGVWLLCLRESECVPWYIATEYSDSASKFKYNIIRNNERSIDSTSQRSAKMLSAVVAATFWFSLTLAALSLDNGTVPYTALSLPDPSNWKTKTNAGGGSLIETLYKPYNQYNASGWTRYMLAECESWGGGTCVGYSGEQYEDGQHV